MSDKIEDIDGAIEWLEEIIDEDGTEVGEFLRHLVAIHNYSDCFSNEEIGNAIEKEIFAQAKFFDENYEMVERDEIIPERIIKVKELVEKE